ncbi:MULTISPECIES: hypothetical protein [Vibrio]|uniref:hypothetical protein n=1 Tax=Vibrio TaxID=662 RepID=UPI00030E6EE3|nr:MULTISPECIES: hypothetical protein [Vibrio]MCB5451475.1 hypothetical protein [Vibrio lentus]OED87636.1 hypothetical protein OAQ_07565 [Vibrio cyclitrophicus ZF30]OEE17120.1 hypothetical protein OC1_00505 [Vibrio cyclitrophicus ZF207]PMH03556.1 hypothetical protein BCU78_00260 [Vibrio lentus]PMJ37198.1 hypothetical protein BCU25_00010 [Vibrio cyclitrophicus]
MESFFEKFSVAFCVISLLLVGTLIGSFFETSLFNWLSLASNISTILAFWLAGKAYYYWVRKDTIGTQKQTIREILVELVELDDNLHEAFARVALQDYQKNPKAPQENDANNPVFPNEKERIFIQKSSLTMKRIKVLMKKYYVFELNNSNSPEVSRSLKTSFKFEGDIFSDLKDLLFKCNRLNHLIDEGSTLQFDNLILKSTHPYEINSTINQATTLYCQTNFFGIAFEFGKHIQEIEQKLILEIS